MHIKFTPKDICLIAVLAAIVFVMTVVLRVPIPLGYAHLGDAAIMLAAYYGGKKNGALASALGSALSDFIGGYPIWIIFLAHGAGILPLGCMACGWIYTGRSCSVRLSGGRPYLDTGPYCRSRSEYGGGIWCRSSS